MRIRWHNDARRRVAPRTEEDLQLVSYRWSINDWKQMVGILEPVKTARTQEKDLEEPLRAVEGWTKLELPPKDIKQDELRIALAIVGAARGASFFARSVGIAMVVQTMAEASVTSTWLSSENAWQIARKKGAIEGRVMRELLIHAKEDVRADCREKVKAAWEAADTAGRVEIAFAFFWDEEWRTQVLAEILRAQTAFDSRHITFARTVDDVRDLISRVDASKQRYGIEYTEIVATLGEEALPLLMTLAPKIRGTTAHASHATALSVFICDEVAEHFAKRLTNPPTRETIRTYFKSNPKLAEKVLPAAAEGASRNAALVKALLVDIVGVTEPEREMVGLDHPSVPAILRDAPWRNPQLPLPDMGLSLDAWPERVEIDEATRTRIHEAVAAQRKHPDMSDEELEAYKKSLGASHQYYWIAGERSLPLPYVLELFLQGKFSSYSPDTSSAMLVLFGERALRAFHPAGNRADAIPREILVGIDSARIAVMLAHHLVRRHQLPNAGRWVWFDAQPRAAAYGLLATIHDPTRHRTHEVVLRRLAKRHPAAVLEMAERTKHPDRVRALLERDPRWDTHAFEKTDYVSGVARPALRDGTPLDNDVAVRIDEMVTLLEAEHPYVGYEEVRAACDPKSLAQMSWDLAALSEGTGRASRRRAEASWKQWAVVPYGDDATIRRLTPALKHPDIYRALEVLAFQGSRAARLEIATAEHREDPQAKNAMQRVADALGITRDELVEQMLPTTPLEPDGAMTLAYGKREIRVGFDTTLAPLLTEGEKRLASLPRAKKSDDPIAVRLAKETWDELKEDVRTIASARYEILERMMRTKQSIPCARFLSGWARHPLGRHLTRGMIWGVVRDDALVTFRVAEDESMADIEDRELVLAENESIYVPHPLDMGREHVDRWSQTFVDYGLIQPVHQLGRVSIDFTPAELAATVIERVPGSDITTKQYQRVLRGLGFQYATRPMTRARGDVQIGYDGTWKGKYVVTKLKLEFRRDGAAIPLQDVEPVERAEGMFALRAVLEAK